MKVHNDILFGSPKARDPHHGGCNEWCFHDGNFYHRHGIQQWWTRVKNVSLTPARIKVLYSLMEKESS